MLSVFLQVIRRDLLLAMRQKSDVLNTLFFFVVVVTMVPLGIGPEPALLRDIAAGVSFPAAQLWIGGDHLGPNAWRAEPADLAIGKAVRVVLRDTDSY